MKFRVDVAVLAVPLSRSQTVAKGTQILVGIVAYQLLVALDVDIVVRSLQTAGDHAGILVIGPQVLIGTLDLSGPVLGGHPVPALLGHRHIVAVRLDVPVPYGKRCGLASGLGTTVTALLLTEQRYYIINVGDTRAYEIGDHVVLLTKDQTVVAREVELGNLTQVEAETDPRRSVLLQCVGASDEVYPDMFFGDTALNATYMLCSDGFRHEITEREIYAYLNPTVMTDADGMQRNMEALIELNKQRRERDNISVVTIRTF